MLLRAKVIQIIFCAILASPILAQDIHFSQFDASNMFLNPALTGSYHGDWQAGIQHRKQWKSIADPFVSNAVFFDRHFYYFNQQINGGIIWISDQAGSSQLTTSKIMLSLAYPIRRGRSTVSIGVQPGMVSKFFNNNLSYPSQFNDNTGYFDSSLPNSINGQDETLDYGKTNINYFDLNAGLSWQMNLPKFVPSIGIAFFHLTQPSESFYNTNNKLSVRQVIHGDITVYFKKGLYVRPAFQHQGMKSSSMMNVGTDFGKKFYKKGSSVKELFAGVYYRSGISRNEDAIYPVLGMNYKNWRIAMSYDYNISGLKVATETKGAYEISIIYTAPSSLPRHTTIPCERY